MCVMLEGKMHVSRWRGEYMSHWKRECMSCWREGACHVVRENACHVYLFFNIFSLDSILHQ